MTPMRYYARFKESFPWMVDDAVKYRGCKDGGIDIFFKDGRVLNFSRCKDGWLLKVTDRKP